MQTKGTGASTLLDALYILQELLDGPRSYWALLRASPRHAAAFVADLRHLLEEGLVAHAGSHLWLTEDGRALAARQGLRARQDVTCPACRGRGIVAAGELRAVLERLRALRRQAPEPLACFDQGAVTAEVSVLRVAWMHRQGDLAGRALLLLGDDDLTSLAAALSGLPRRIHVLEADERLVRFLTDVARAEGWEGYLSVEPYDVRDGLPERLQGRFDVFLTDPVETLEGIRLFLSRATEALREGGAGYFGLTRLESSLAKWREIQRSLLEMGYAITAILPQFQEYELEHVLDSGWRIVTEAPVPVEEPDVLFYTSSLVRVQLVGAPQPAVTGPVLMGDELYVDDEAYVTAPEAGERPEPRVEAAASPPRPRPSFNGR